MQHYSASIFLVVGIMSAFWAYTIIDSLVREFSKDVTVIDLGVIFVLGLIAGAAVALSYVFGRKRLKA